MHSSTNLLSTFSSTCTRVHVFKYISTTLKYLFLDNKYSYSKNSLTITSSFESSPTTNCFCTF